MSKDIRLNSAFRAHPKTLRLMSVCGEAGVLSLIYLWCWASEFRPKGDLSGLTIREIENACGWHGPAGKLFFALLSIGLLDGELPVDNPVDNPVDKISIHDWRDNNPYVYFSQERRLVAQKAAEKRWGNAKKWQ